jgi:hypothetical protein
LRSSTALSSGTVSTSTRNKGISGKASDANDPYAVASAGGRHAGFLRSYSSKSVAELDRGIRSIEKQIALHEDKIRNPNKHVPNFVKLDPRQQKALVEKTWPSDIQRQQEQLAILKRLRAEKEAK